ncbi:MAG: complex I NDUFA9 subunit family protein, partial [Paracoccaceae bacterium]
AAAAARAAAGEAPAGIYELGGPKVYPFRELMVVMLAKIRRRRLLASLPFFAATILATLLDMVQAISFGLISNTILTRDQVELLKSDNVAAPGAPGFAALGLSPVSVESMIGDYLYSYRPHGQYDAITESAARLKS